MDTAFFSFRFSNLVGGGLGRRKEKKELTARDVGEAVAEARGPLELVAGGRGVLHD